MSVKGTGENPLERIFQSENMRIDETQSSSGGLLARWWREMLKNLNFDIISFSERLTHYLEITKQTSNRVAASNARGSFNKKLADSEFTWKVFLEAIKILGVWKIEFSIKLHHIDGNTSSHSIDALLMNEEMKTKYIDRWNQYHGVHPVNNEYLETLKEHRRQIIQGNAERAKEQTGQDSYYGTILKRNESPRKSSTDDNSTGN